MSLINKMLQDLDARGAQAGQLAEVRPVPGSERGVAPRTVLIGAAGLLALLAALLGWRFMHGPAPALVSVPAQALVSVPAPAQPIVSIAAPVPATTPAAKPAPAATPAAKPAPAATPAARPAPAATPAAVTPPATPAAAPPPAAAVMVAAPGAPPEALAPPRLQRQAKRGLDAKPPAHGTDRMEKPAGNLEQASGAAVSAAPLAQGKQSSARQRAENAYRRALAALQEGRTSEAIAGLQQALSDDPSHQASRETLIPLLLENQRQDEAMRQLQSGLALDPNQPALAMLLARLQLEQGGPAFDTLMRTLPFAAGNGDYQAFLAAVLQRGQRHKEAAVHYALALHTAPQRGVWWMGLGISLQAEQRLAEARDAFARARASPDLTPELQAFVARQLR